MNRRLLLPLRRINFDHPYQPTIYSFPAATDLRTRPRAVYDAATDTERGLSGQGALYLGPQSYSLIAAITNFALPNALMNLGHHNDEATRLIHRSEGSPGISERERLHMLQWLMINQICIAIEALAALCVATEAWRATRDDIAKTYLRAPSSSDWIRSIVSDPARAKATYWRKLLSYPGRPGLRRLGLSHDEADALDRVVRETVWIAANGMRFAARFFSADVSRLYARYKHGFSLLSTTAAPIFFDRRVTKRRLDRALRDDHLVLLDVARTATKILILKCTSVELARTLFAAQRIAAPLGILAGSIHQEARSNASRSILLATKAVRPLTELERRAHSRYGGYNPDDARYHMRTMDEIVRPEFARLWPRDRLETELTAPELW